VCIFREAFHSCRSLFLIYALIAVASTDFFLASLVNPVIIIVLSASSHTPWGIVTSLFIHGDGLWHLSNNLVALFALFLLLSMSNLNSSTRERRVIIIFLLISIFLAAVVSNFLWVMLVPNGITSGLSGVVFATEGVLVAFSLRNSMTMFRLAKRDTKEEKRVQTLWMLNLLVFLLSFIQIVSNPRLSLNVAQGVNSFVHGVAFLSNFSLTITWSFLKDDTSLIQLKENAWLFTKV
jgi:hypothetical protein